MTNLNPSSSIVPQVGANQIVSSSAPKGSKDLPAIVNLPNISEVNAAVRASFISIAADGSHSYSEPLAQQSIQQLSIPANPSHLLQISSSSPPIDQPAANFHAATVTDNNGKVGHLMVPEHDLDFEFDLAAIDPNISVRVPSKSNVDSQQNEVSAPKLATVASANLASNSVDDLEINVQLEDPIEIIVEKEKTASSAASASASPNGPPVPADVKALQSKADKQVENDFSSQTILNEIYKDLLDKKHTGIQITFNVKNNTDGTVGIQQFKNKNNDTLYRAEVEFTITSDQMKSNHDPKENKSISFSRAITTNDHSDGKGGKPNARQALASIRSFAETITTLSSLSVDPKDGNYRSPLFQDHFTPIQYATLMKSRSFIMEFERDSNNSKITATSIRAGDVELNYIMGEKIKSQPRESNQIGKLKFKISHMRDDTRTARVRDAKTALKYSEVESELTLNEHAGTFIKDFDEAVKKFNQARAVFSSNKELLVAHLKTKPVNEDLDLPNLKKDERAAIESLSHMHEYLDSMKAKKADLEQLKTELTSSKDSPLSQKSYFEKALTGNLFDRSMNKGQQLLAAIAKQDTKIEQYSALLNKIEDELNSIPPARAPDK